MEYEVIIIGGGPVGIALGIELGMHNVRTLILEKHDKPLRTPRAQSLSARTMEFFLRWGIDKQLESRLLLKHLPQTGIWCPNLCGEAYFVGKWGDNQLEDNASPKAGVRVPLWITEEVLRERLRDFPCVDFLKNHEVMNAAIIDSDSGSDPNHSSKNKVQVEAFDKITQKKTVYYGQYLACCDGAAGPSKALFKNNYTPMSDKSKMLGTLFIVEEMMQKKKVPDGIMYFVTSDDAMAFVGSNRSAGRPMACSNRVG